MLFCRSVSAIRADATATPPAAPGSASVRGLRFPQHRTGLSLSLKPPVLPLLQGPLLLAPAARHRCRPLPAGLALASPPAPGLTLPSVRA